MGTQHWNHPGNQEARSPTVVINVLFTRRWFRLELLVDETRIEVGRTEDQLSVIGISLHLERMRMNIAPVVWQVVARELALGAVLIIAAAKARVAQEASLEVSYLVDRLSDLDMPDVLQKHLVRIDRLIVLYVGRGIC